MGVQLAKQRDLGSPETLSSPWYQWLLAVNNVLRQWVDECGIGYYTTASRPTSPLRWPWLGVSIDQGSDGWSATQYAIYELKANWERFPDPSHGAGIMHN